MKLPERVATVAEMVARLEDVTHKGARFVDAAGRDEFFPYSAVARRARSAAGALQAAGVKPGDRVGVVLPTSIQFFDSFLGIQLAGGIPAALYPPIRLGKLDEYFARIRRMLTKIGARFLITDSRVRRLLGQAVDGVSSIENVIDAGTLESGAPGKIAAVDPDSPAFLQFSSGSTVEPKAVMVSHTNLVENLMMMLSSLGEYSEEDFLTGGVCWLPLYHDMGLLGCLYLGLFSPGTVTYIGPETFIARPALWLKTISRYKAVISPAPHFAYGLCLKKVKDAEMQGVDLSSWRYALNGAEPIDVPTMEAFCDRFAQWGFRREALSPVYGLAEAGLGVSFSETGRAPLVTEFDRDALSRHKHAVPGKGRQLPSVGKPLPGLALKIRDGKTDLPEGQVGRICVKGPSITKGYYGDPELTASMIHDGWLDTGDLGFLHDGELYITGRAKDLIIIRGRNYAPHEVEELLLNLDGLRTGCTVAAGTMVEGAGEELIVLAEKDLMSDRPTDEIVAEIQSRILSGLSLSPYDVVILPPGTLPRTSSGKLRRSAALEQFLAGTLAPPEKVTTLKLLKEVGKSQLAWAKFALRKNERGA